MDQAALLAQAQNLKTEVDSKNKEKAISLEASLTHESTCYAWKREQMIAIHQMKYHFTKEVLKLHQEFRKLNQEMRCQIERLRSGQPLLSVPSESPDAKNKPLTSDAS